jgi:hypothetical protein
LAILLIASCAKAPAASYGVSVRAESDPQKPLAHVRITSRGAPLGETDADGLLRFALTGSAGDVVPLETQCPEGHRSPKPLSVVLRPLADGRPEFRVACQPLTRAIVVAVRAQNGVDLPLRYLGQEIARTDGSGAAHALLDVPPGETVTLTLDTSAQAKLMPQHPELKVVVPERDEIVVFDEKFKLPKPPHKKRPPPEPTGPQRIR